MKVIWDKKRKVFVEAKTGRDLTHEEQVLVVTALRNKRKKLSSATLIPVQ